MEKGTCKENWDTKYILDYWIGPDTQLLALKIEEEAKSQGMQEASRIW